MAGDWRARVTAILKEELEEAKDPKTIREIASAMSAVQPYEDAVSERPMPVRVVGRAKRARKKGSWRKRS